MDKDKQRLLTLLLSFVKEQYDHPDNKEFAAGIQALVLNDIKHEDDKEEWTQQISEIYELCLKKNLKEQAEDLYKDFPMTDIAEDLVSLYVDMENARRANDFDEFGFFLYQQIELIVNTLCQDPEIVTFYDGIRSLPPVMRYDAATKSIIRSTDRYHATVEDYILLLTDQKTKQPLNKGKGIAALPATEKNRAIVYLLCFDAEVEAYPRDQKTIQPAFQTLYAIYCVRNHNAHSGATPTENQIMVYNGLLADKTQNYLRFIAFLLSFIKGVSRNYPLPQSLKTLAEPPQKPQEENDS